MRFLSFYTAPSASSGQRHWLCPGTGNSIICSIPQYPLAQHSTAPPEGSKPSMMQEFSKSHSAWKPCLQLHWDTHSCHCWFTFSSRGSWVKSERGPVLREGKERPKKEANHSRLVGGSLNKQENLLRKLVLGDLKISRFPHLPARILKVLKLKS